MKKLLLSSILCLASLALWAAPSQAWTFGLIPAHCCPFSCLCDGCCGKCCSTICIRPYNAFSPVCSGSLCCDGCVPFCNPCCGAPACGAPGCGYPACGPSCCPAAPSCGGCACDPCSPPAPGPGPGAQAAPYQGPVQSAAYQVPAYGYAPAYYPQSVAPMAPPWYWSAGGYGR